MTEIEKLAERISELETAVKDISENQLLSNIELRRSGVNNGSQGVKGAYLLIAFIFIASAIFSYLGINKVVFTPIHLIYLGLVVSIGLVAYFGFIFKFTIGAEVSRDSVKITTRDADNG